ncbi:hypothetical protein Mapa_000932 [Marchantia paleacea]|nr:hypothetical protein Mapa_000932 [Marchantia paleacea]
MVDITIKEQIKLRHDSTFKNLEQNRIALLFQVHSVLVWKKLTGGFFQLTGVILSHPSGWFFLPHLTIIIEQTMNLSPKCFFLDENEFRRSTEGNPKSEI